MTLARDAMTGGVESIPPHGTVSRAAEIMTRSGVGALPICDVRGQLLGMITDRDIVMKVLGAGRPPATTQVSELLTGETVSIDVDQDVAEALFVMITHRVRRLPVVDEGTVVGLVSYADLARALPHPRTGDLVEALSTD